MTASSTRAPRRPCSARGRRRPEAMFVGEQPGDREEPRGTPVRRPGRADLRQSAGQGASIDRTLVYVTNTVKHFHYEQRGKRRIHQRPRAEHINACRQWLDGRARGGQSARARVPGCGKRHKAGRGAMSLKVTQDRGKALDSELAPVVMVTVHPSSILRFARRRRAVRRHTAPFVSDLRAVAAELGAG